MLMSDNLDNIIAYDKKNDNIININEMNIKIESELDLTKKLNIFSDVFNVIDEIVKIIKKEKVEETNQQTDSNKIII